MDSSGVKCFSTFFMQTCVCVVVYSESTVDGPLFLSTVSIKRSSIHAGTHRCHWNLQVIPWYTPEIYVSITSRSYSDLRNKWELNLVRSLFFILHWVHAVLRILNRNMGKEEELLKIVHNNDEKKLQVNTDPEVGDQITHCMYWVDFGVCYAMSFFNVSNVKCKCLFSTSF